MHTSDLYLQCAQALQEKFALQEFREKQRVVIERIFEGKNTLALLPTGYGKSLCYQAPAQVLPGITLVVSPLIALMEDQLSGLMRRGITNATLINSSLDYSETRERFENIANGVYKIVYVAPERFESQRFRELIANIPISLFVVDEAHCISQWGHDFRPQYRNLKTHIEELKPGVVLALTATATRPVASDISQILGLPPGSLIEGCFDRPNLHLDVVGISKGTQKDYLLPRMLEKKTDLPAIVYTSSRKETERLADLLKQKGHSVAFYHAGMSPDKRTRAQRSFEQGNVDIIVSTVAFGMGVDKADIRQVIHFNLPASLENYYQEAGRAGRDGEKAVCTLFFHTRDIMTQRWLIDRNYPTKQQVLSTWQYITGNRGCTTQDIARETGLPDVTVNSAVDFLRTSELVRLESNSGLVDLDTDEYFDLDITLLEQRKYKEKSRLNHMVAYAESNRCRRRSILEYFGQKLESNCSGCDVCTPAPPIHMPDGKPESQHVPSARAKSIKTPNADVNRLILSVVSLLSGQVGRTTIAQILSGSRAAKIIEKHWDRLPGYAELSHHRQDDILSAIDALAAANAIQVSHGMYPKVTITTGGRQQLM